MSLISQSDLARSFQLQLQYTRTKSELSRLTQEFSSGEHADPGRALRGEFSALTSVERSLKLSSAYSAAAAEATLLTSTAQASLETFQTNMEGVASQLLSATAIGSASQMRILANAAPDRFEAMVQSINQRVSGRALFAGAATDQVPLISDDDILAALDPIATAAPDTATLIADLESWFMDPGGGFETVVYQGAANPAPGFAVAEGEIVSNPVSALDPGIRKALMGMALTALVARGVGPSSDEDRAALLGHAAISMADADAEVTDLRARLGDAEARIASAQARTETHRAAMELERGRLLGVDPYDTATRLEETQTRLESLYLLTTRLSRLSLTEFLR